MRKRLGVKKASFADPDQTRDLTGMLIGGVTALRAARRPARSGSTARVVERPRIVLGGGSRSCKVVGPPALLTAQPMVEVVDDLAVDQPPGERSAQATQT